MNNVSALVARSIAIVSLIAFGSCSSPSPPADASADAANDVTGSDGDAPDAVSGCPADLPADGSACAPLGRSCEFGSFSWHDCNARSICTTRGWSVSAPVATVCVSNNTMCPASAAAITPGSVCTTQAIECFYRESTCYCARPTGADGGASTWICDEPAADCPTPRPLLGTACDTDGQECDYSACFLHNVRQRCQGGVWVETTSDCDGG